MRVSVACFLLIALGFWCCDPPEKSTDPSYLILISIDGFRYDYAEKFGASNILKFKEEGASAKRMIPSFPSKTFPNHYTLVTGLYPDHHGLVGNVFYNPQRDAWYKVGSESVYDSSWYGGTPLWALAGQQGMKSASYFWPGSEANIQGYKPIYTKPYDGDVPNSDRFNQVIDWLKLPQEERPQFISLYFSLVDNAGHRYGPDGDGTKEAVLEIDSLFGVFMENLDQVDLPVNVVLVSDHGMSVIKYGVVLPDLVDLSGMEVSNSLPVMIYSQDSIRLAGMYDTLRADGRFEVYKKGEVPDYLHFGNHTSVGDLVLIPNAPTVLLSRPMQVYGGTHGFDPYNDLNMSAFFAANGPAFKSGVEIEKFENIHLYPMMAEVLALSVTDSVDGELKVLAPILK